jgi:hypothetical protein
MAVKISAAKPIVICPVRLFLTGDHGTQVLHQFDVHFKRMKTEERDELNTRFAAGELTMRTLLNEIVKGWDGMLDEAGAPVQYSIQERIATDSEYPGLEQAMVVSWFDHFFINQREAAAKNSVAPSATA